MTDLATLVVKLEAQTAQFQSSLDTANKQIKSLRDESANTIEQLKQFGEILGVGELVKQLVELGDQIIENAEHLEQLSKETGIAADSLSELQFAAKLEGVDSLDTVLLKLSKSAGLASAGNDKLAGAFKALGIQVVDGEGNLKTTDSLLLEVADSFNKHADGAAKAAIAQELLGKSGAQFIAFLDQGSEAIKQQMGLLDDLGGKVTPEAAEAAKEFTQETLKLKTELVAMVQQAILPALPALTAFVEALRESVTHFSDSAKSSGELSTELSKLATFITNVYKVFTAFLSIENAFNEAIGSIVRTVNDSIAVVIDAVSHPLTAKETLSKGFAQIQTNIKGSLTKIAVDIGYAAKQMVDVFAEPLDEIIVKAEKIGEIKPQIQLPDDSAIKKLEDAITGLKQKAGDLDVSSGLKKTNLQAAETAISIGNLKDAVNKAGAEGKNLAQQYLEAAAALDKVEASAGLAKLTEEVEKQIETFGKGKVALAEYTVSHGILGAQLQQILPDTVKLNAALAALVPQNATAVAQNFESSLKGIGTQLDDLAKNAGVAKDAQADLTNALGSSKSSGTVNVDDLQKRLDKLKEVTKEQQDYNAAQTDQKSSGAVKNASDDLGILTENIKGATDAQNDFTTSVVNTQKIQSNNASIQQLQSQIDSVRKLQSAQADYASQLSKFNDTRSAEAGIEAQITAQVLDGSKKQSEANTDIAASRKQELVDLQAIAQRLNAIAAATGLPELQAQAKAANTVVAALSQTVNNAASSATKLRNQSQDFITKSTIAEVQGYQDSIKNLDIQIATLGEHSAQVAGIQFDLANKSLLAAAAETKDAGGAALQQRLDTLKSLQQAQADFNQELTDFNRIRTKESQDEQSLNDLKTSGAIDEITYDKQISDLRRQATKDLQDEYDQMSGLSQLFGDSLPKIKDQTAAAGLEIKNLAASTDELAKKLKNDFINDASDAFTAFVTGSKTAKQALTDFVGDIEKELIKLATNKLLEQLFSSGSGIFGQVAGFLGGSSGGPKAAGGAVSAGMSYTIGEHGAEEFVPDSNGTIIPNGKMGKSQTIINNFNIQAPGGQITRQTQQQIAAQAGSGINRATRRNT